MDDTRQIVAEVIKDHETRCHKTARTMFKPPALEEKNKYMSIFEEARELYPGTKRGLKTEFEHFIWRSKHPKAGTPPFNYIEVLSLLKSGIESQICGRRKIGAREFVPPWKNFKTWISNQCWQEEGKAVDRPETSKEKVNREKAEAAALEKRKQEIRDDEKGYYQAQTTETLQKWLPSYGCFTRRWLIREILAERTKQ